MLMMSENYALSLRCTPWPFLCSQGQGERALAMGTEAAYDTVAFDYKSLSHTWLMAGTNICCGLAMMQVRVGKHLMVTEKNTNSVSSLAIWRLLGHLTSIPGFHFLHQTNEGVGRDYL